MLLWREVGELQVAWRAEISAIGMQIDGSLAALSAMDYGMESDV